MFAPATSQSRALTSRRALGLIVGALVSVAMTAGARAEAPDSAGQTAFWDALGESMRPAELARIKALPGIDDAIGLLMKGFDGDGDALVVEATTDGIRVNVKTAERVCPVRLTGPESGAQDGAGVAPCPLVPDGAGPRTLELDRGIWTIPQSRPTPRNPRPPVETPTETPTETQDAPIGTLMRIRIGSEPWQILRAFVPDDLEQRHLEWRERVGRTDWRDPLLPRDALEAGAALMPLQTAAPPGPAERQSALENLRNPFDDSRMRTADPLPQVFKAVGNGSWSPGTVGFAMPPMSPGCKEEVEHPGMLERAPTLTCFQAVSWHARHLFNKLPAPVAAFLNVLQVPIINEIRMFADADATRSNAYETAWAITWLEWVRERGARVDSALRELTEQERRLLRRFVGRWWARRMSPEYKDIIGVLVETRFTGLYPEATDIAGLPRRSFFEDTWLWAGNWIAAAIGTPLTEREERVARSLETLTRADVGDLLARLELAQSDSPAVQHLVRTLRAFAGGNSVR